MTKPACSRFVVLAAVATFAAVAASNAGAQSFRAVWADAFSVGFKSNAQITDLVNRAVAGRYNAIIAEVLAFHDNVGSGHGAYWTSNIVPEATDVSGGIDPLAQLIAVAHAANIEVHAWIVPYRVSSVWPPSGNALVAAHPEWLMVDQASAGGGPDTVGSYFTLDPGSPESQEYLVSIVRELVTNYQIDGINLDYIRYVQTNAGYPADNSYQNSSLARFRRQTGFVGTPPPTGNTAWNDFRRQTIDEYVKRLRAEIPSIPNVRQPLRLTGDLICFGNAPASFTSSDAYILHQNWQLWMQRGWLDAGIPMNYKRDHVANEATWYRNWVNAAMSWRYNRHMFAGQGNYLNTKANSVAQMAYAVGQGTHGQVNFSYDATADDNTNGTPETDWTWYPYVATNLFTSTTPTPTMPWRNAATATEGTLWGRVTNSSTGLPVENATVTAAGQPAVQTDGNGYYVITLLPAGVSGTAYNVTASSAASGCPNLTANGVLVPRGGIVRRDIGMCPPAIQPGDMDQDGDIDIADLNSFFFCMQGPAFTYPLGQFCLRGDADANRTVDLADFVNFQENFAQVP
ncbi:MAG: family 10 glycosylhydrolase [Phycisphaerae bacterium]